MSSFLYAVGLPYFVVTLAFLLFYAARYMPKGMDSIFRVFGYLSAFTGFFFLTWALNPFVQSDYHPAVYYAAMIAVSAVLTLVIRLYVSTMARVFKKLDSMLDFMVEIRNVHFSKILKIAIRKDLYDTTYQNQLKQTTINFDHRLYEKSEDLLD